jgi:hypothetical protein
MKTAAETLDHHFLEMRWRCLSLAADLDRIDRAGGGIASDARLNKFREAVKVLLQNEPDRAARVQMIFSDMTPPSPRSSK